MHSYVLMTNHVHLIVTPRGAGGVSQAMQTIGRLYVRHFNRRYERTGGLFDGRYRSFIIDSESYWFTCMRYVELNPVRAGHSCEASGLSMVQLPIQRLGLPTN